jgi:hypothetical protein
MKSALKVTEMTCVLFEEAAELNSLQSLRIKTDDAAVILKTLRYHTKRHGRNINTKSFFFK